jgi:hypothetical protein
MELEVTSPRPVADVALELEKRFGCMVSYEDVPYYHPNDIAQDEEGRTIPRGGRLLVKYQTGDDVRDIIARTLAAHAASGYPGVFAWENCSSGYCILPSSFRNSAGDLQERLPLLNTKISIPAKKRTGLQLVEDVLQALSTARRESTVAGTFPINAFVQHVGVSEAFNVKVRDILLDLFRDIGLPLSWQILNDPGEAKFYLNIHQLPKK